MKNEPLIKYTDINENKANFYVFEVAFCYFIQGLILKLFPKNLFVPTKDVYHQVVVYRLNKY